MIYKTKPAEKWQASETIHFKHKAHEVFFPVLKIF
jgi:hypothetical protein